MKTRKYALHNTLEVPTLFDNVLKARAEMIAPAFPAAALNPWANALKRVGNTSAG